MFGFISLLISVFCIIVNSIYHHASLVFKTQDSSTRILYPTEHEHPYVRHTDNARENDRLLWLASQRWNFCKRFDRFRGARQELSLLLVCSHWFMYTGGMWTIYTVITINLFTTITIFTIFSDSTIYTMLAHSFCDI